MPNLTVEKKWIRWYPEKILFKNKERKNKFLYYADKFNQEDFYIDDQNIKSNLMNPELKKDITITEEYQIGFKLGMLENLKEYNLLKGQLNDLLLDFEKSFSIFEKKIYSRLLKTVLIVSSYVVGQKTDIDEVILLNYIKKVIDQDKIFLHKPKFYIHPKNQVLIENTLKDFLHKSEWTLVFDENIDIKSFKIESNHSGIDATVSTRWQELCHLFDSEAYQ